jgi:hypothetical protein
MIDTQTGTVIPLPIPFDDPANFWIDRYSNGLILSYYQSDTDQAAWVLLDGSQTFIDLPADADTYCYEILADSNVICQSYETGGVLRYEPASGTLTQLSDLPIYMTASGN